MLRFYKKTSLYLVGLLLLIFSIYFFFSSRSHSQLPLIAVGNYGPHSSLDESLRGMKEELTRRGYAENQDIRYEITDTSFNSLLIPQMLMKLKSTHPKVIVVMTTPVAQSAKHSIHDIPVLFNVVTDPVEAGLLSQANKPEASMTGISDRQDLNLVLAFAKELLPHARRVGLLYATGEANDTALVRMMEAAALQAGMEVVAIPVDQAADVPLRMQAFKNNVDFIYIGVSGPIQPTLPAIAAEADKMRIPVLNADSDAARKHQILASFGVDYYRTGVNLAGLIIRILEGEKVESLAPVYPSLEDHHGFISRKKADELGISIPSSLTHVTLVE